MDLPRQVVGMDHSPSANAALRWALRHGGHDGQVHLVHVVDDRDAAEPALERLEDVVTTAAGTTRSSAVLTAHVAVGHRVADTLVEEAARFHSDALVLGVEPREHWNPRHVSPTVAKVHHGREVPMVVVPTTAAAAADVTSAVHLGVDGTEESWEVLGWLAQHLGPRDPLRISWILDAPTGGRLPVPDMAVLKRAVKAYLREQVGAILGSRNPQPRLVVKVGYPVGDLADAAGAADVVVVGHGHHSRIGEALGASVSLQMLRVHDGPVLVVPRPPTGA